MPYIGKSPVGGGFHKLDALTASATDTYALTLGSAAYYPETANQLLVSLNGVIQAPQDSFTVSGSNLIFDSALTSSDSIDFVVALGDVLGVGSVTDGAVTTNKIANGAVTAAKLAAGVQGVAGISSSSTSGTAISIDSSNRVSMDSSHVFDMFELTADITSNQTPISSNLRRVQHAAFAPLNGMSVSSGVFTFPFTGLYRVEFFYKSNPIANDNIVFACQFTTDNSSYSNATTANSSASNAAENSASGIAFINVTNTSQVKVRFNAGSISSGSKIKGSTNETVTGLVFTRLTDAQ